MTPTHHDTGPMIGAAPFLAAARVELAMMENWTRVACAMLGGYAHLIDAVSTNAQRRLESAHRWHDVPPSGADLTEHYGRRHHDIDAEHAV